MSCIIITVTNVHLNNCFHFRLLISSWRLMIQECACIESVHSKKWICLFLCILFDSHILSTVWALKKPSFNMFHNPCEDLPLRWNRMEMWHSYNNDSGLLCCWLQWENTFSIELSSCFASCTQTLPSHHSFSESLCHDGCFVWSLEAERSADDGSLGAQLWKLKWGLITMRGEAVSIQQEPKRSVSYCVDVKRSVQLI